MSACAKRQYGTRAHKGMLYRIEDKVAKINQVIHNVLRGLYLSYCLDSRLNPGLCPVFEVHAHKATKLAFAHANDLDLRNP